ncbi:ParA family protein [Shewanella sp. M-Br]|uniref:ParA family protein n=1 Tax=Shewanella sp. M-Br TaxID=2495595 RepID=UPI00294A65AC|nr:chromosome partitioning protein ParA [Shewanella sp. M-Br]
MKTILFFNNKGGVGKTTLACNLVSYMNIHMGKRILLVDADPQCNTTQMILGDDICEDIYFNKSSDYDTLYSALKPLENGEPQINAKITPVLGTTNNFQTDIIPGHPNMSIIEDILSNAWGDLRSRSIGGLRITNWCHHLTKEFEDRYDYIVFDVGPSLGALNRSIILESDFIITPFGCDIFSLLGIKNISGWIGNWNRIYTKTIDDMIDEGKKEILDGFEIIQDTNLKFRFAGFSVQQYVTRSFKTGRRPVKAYDDVMKEIPSTFTESMSEFLVEKSDISYELGHIPYVNSLVPLSQTNKCPIHQLNSSTGIVGAQSKQVRTYSDLMDAISRKILKNVGGE